MKFRQGFISNSSSSSYIVNIEGIDLDDFLNTLYQEYSWSFFNRERVKNEIYAYLYGSKKRLEENKNIIFKDLEEYWPKESERWKEKFDSLDNDIDLVRFVLDYCHVYTEETKTGIQMTSSVSMHNDFRDMPEIMKEITLYFLMDTKHKVKGERIDES